MVRYLDDKVHLVENKLDKIIVVGFRRITKPPMHPGNCTNLINLSPTLSQNFASINTDTFGFLKKEYVWVLCHNPISKNHLFASSIQCCYTPGDNIHEEELGEWGGNSR
jgi:hypothetical protein